MTTPTPGLDLHFRVRAGFVAQRTSLKRWCRENDIQPTNARDALIGRWDGPKGRALRARLVEAAKVQEAA